MYLAGSKVDADFVIGCFCSKKKLVASLALSAINFIGGVGVEIRGWVWSLIGVEKRVVVGCGLAIE
jgi:hypothetical protein